MTPSELTAALQSWAAAQNLTLTESGNLLYAEPDGWRIALAPDVPDEMDYLKQFEQAMGLLVAAQAETESQLNLGLALAFSSTQRGETLSYRRALKKYSSSVVFTDLNIHLLFVRDDASVEVLPPEAINPFLRDLNRWIAGQKR
jgi:hypothetical protein